MLISSFPSNENKLSRVFVWVHIVCVLSLLLAKIEVDLKRHICIAQVCL